MATILVYWTGTGNTEALAFSIADGVKQGGGACEVVKVSDADLQKTAAYDKIILGCPAMGAEELENTEFEPFYSALEPLLKGKTVGLFGSYDWGDGEWMRLWQKRAEDAGVSVLDTLIVQSAESGADETIAFGKKFA
ncbi:MAG: flavodoxin [Clostridiales bacterium]|jgi:flavodoxin short chain|nr:flavodoxin [Clostridiales bacterium]